MKTIPTKILIKIIKPISKLINRLIVIRDDPKKIAYGFALGTFLGFMPIIGLQAAIAVIIASLLKWNRISAGIAVFNTNVVTGPFVFGLSYITGSYVLGFKNKINIPDKLGFTVFWDLVSRSSEILISLSFGGILLGLPTSVLAYYLSLSVVRNYQLRRSSKQKHLLP